MNDPSLDPTLDRVLTRLRELSDQHYSLDLEALRREFLAKGHDPSTVDHAIEIFMGKKRSAPRLLIGLKIPVVVAFNVLVVLMFGRDSGIYGIFVNGIFVVEIMVGLAFTSLPKTRPWGFALFFGSLLSLALLIVFATGLCFYRLSREPYPFS